MVMCKDSRLPCCTHIPSKAGNFWKGCELTAHFCHQSQLNKTCALHACNLWLVFFFKGEQFAEVLDLQKHANLFFFICSTFFCFHS